MHLVCRPLADDAHQWRNNNDEDVDIDDSDDDDDLLQRILIMKKFEWE